MSTISARVFCTNDIAALIAKCYIKHPKDFATLMLVCKGYDHKHIFSILLENLVINHFNYYIVCKFLHRGISFASLSPTILEKLVLSNSYCMISMLINSGIVFDPLSPLTLEKLVLTNKYSIISMLLTRGISFDYLLPSTLEKLVLADYYVIVHLLLKYGVSFDCCAQPHILDQLNEKKQYGMLQLLLK